MCEFCQKDDIRVGDKVWKAIIDDFNKPKVVIAWARVLTAPNKRLEMRIQPQEDHCGAFSYKRTISLRYIQHSKAAALSDLFTMALKEEAEAQERTRLVRAAVRAQAKE